jgi:glutathione S-transferase
MSKPKLYIGNKNYSSWSIRAWLGMRTAGVDFQEVVIPLDQPGSTEEIRRHSPSGKLPALHDGGTIVWESLAILEYLAERHPQAKLWPEDPAVRAVARSVAAEMHAGFAHLRGALPMNIRRSYPNRQFSAEAQADINRILAIWRDARSRFGVGGEFLFGSFGAADCMFMPAVSRFFTYKIEMDDISAAYARAVWNRPIVQEIVAAARNEPMVIEKYEF